MRVASAPRAEFSGELLPRAASRHGNQPTKAGEEYEEREERQEEPVREFSGDPADIVPGELLCNPFDERQ